MDILFHSHHAVISPSLRHRTERGLRTLAQRFGSRIGATVRFEEDGPTRRVEIVLTVPKSRRFVAVGEGRFFGPAVSAALNRLAAQLDHLKRSKKTEARRPARA